MEHGRATFSLHQGKTKTVSHLFTGRSAKCRNYHVYVRSMGTMFFIREVHVHGCRNINIQERADTVTDARLSGSPSTSTSTKKQEEARGYKNENHRNCTRIKC